MSNSLVLSIYSKLPIVLICDYNINSFLLEISFFLVAFLRRATEKFSRYFMKVFSLETASLFVNREMLVVKVFSLFGSSYKELLR